MLLRVLSGLLFTVCVSAQFNFYEQFFGGGHQQRQEQPQGRGVGWLKQHYDSAACNQYLCEDTLSCVDSPRECPCPFGQDKCDLGKHGDYVCISPVNGRGGCDFVMGYLEGNAY
jgi:hypothetical protein